MSEVELPQVTGGFGDTPELLYPMAPKPKGLCVKTLVEGSGPVIMSGQTITVNYHGEIWDGGVFDSSYYRGAPIDFAIGVGQVIAGWDEAIVGKTVGSRLLISIPPEKGYGSRGVPQAGIGGGDTLVFVVDIIAAR